MTKSLVKLSVRSLLGVLTAAVVFSAAPAEAQIVRVGTTADSRQSFGFTLGYFKVKGDDSRVDGDVIFNNHGSLIFDTDEFNGFTFGGEYLFALTDYIELGAGISYYEGSTPSIYQFTDDDGFEIAQELKLRQIPMSATARFLPLGRRGSVQPYIGAGITAINWRYSETGDFVDFEDLVFPGKFVASGTAVGPVILGGVRFPVSDMWTIGGEFRWHKADGDTGGINEGFLGDKIDLGGTTYNFTVHFRF
jgi:opacity protein-like surface antigen